MRGWRQAESERIPRAYFSNPAVIHRKGPEEKEEEEKEEDEEEDEDEDE